MVKTRVGRCKACKRIKILAKAVDKCLACIAKGK